MKSDDAPIEATEILVRRIHYNHFSSEKRPGFPRVGFQPQGQNKKKPDTTGISMYRRDCLESPDQALSEVPADKRPHIGLVGFTVQELRDLGCSVKSEPTSIPGHVVIPELNCIDAEGADADKRERIDAVVTRLAALAGEPGRVIRQPTKPPASENSPVEPKPGEPSRPDA